MVGRLVRFSSHQDKAATDLSILLTCFSSGPVVMSTGRSSLFRLLELSIPSFRPHDQRLLDCCSAERATIAFSSIAIVSTYTKKGRYRGQIMDRRIQLGRILSSTKR